MKASLANIITVSRILFSLCLFIFGLSSIIFALLYLLCGVSDVLDGFLARKLHTETKTGEMLDSIADLFFAVAYAVRILPFLHLPIWILIWTVVIAVIKISGILKMSIKEKRFYINHSPVNKLLGIFIFILPMTACFLNIKYSAAVVCAVATVAATVEFLRAKGKTNAK